MVYWGCRGGRLGVVLSGDSEGLENSEDSENSESSEDSDRTDEGVVSGWTSTVRGVVTGTASGGVLSVMVGGIVVVCGTVAVCCSATRTPVSSGNNPFPRCITTPTIATTTATHASAVRRCACLRARRRTCSAASRCWRWSAPYCSNSFSISFDVISLCNYSFSSNCFLSVS